MTEFTPPLENVYSCPVCLGIPLKKMHFASEAPHLVLDFCERCGGMWFDKNEVEQLRHCHPHGLPEHIPLNEDDFLMNCHQCHQPMKREENHCSFCHWKNRLDCPICEEEMSQIKHQGLTLDVCKTCKGVWFDNVELAHIWNEAYVPQSKSNHPVTYEHGFTDMLLAAGDIMVHNPFLAAEVIEATPYLVEGVVEGVSALPEVAGSLFEGAADIGEAAGSIFEVIAEILGGIFG